MPKLPPDAPGSRKTHVKSRAGCLTCKIRRVKCGEERPSCVRCVALGTSCRYKDTPPKSLISRPRYPPLAPQVIAKVMPTHFKFETEDGHRYFDTFQSKTSFQILSHSAVAESLRLILLQAGSSDSSIRHAIAALGALEKTSEAASETLQYDDHWGQSNRHQQNALKLYSRAIAHMKNDALGGKQDRRTALLTCLVTLCFEAWTGNRELALKQMQAGINLIQEWKTNGTSPPSNSTFSSSVEDDIVEVFDRLAIQVVTFTDAAHRTRAVHDSLERDGLDLLSNMPAKFSSLKEAGYYQSIMMRYGMHLLVDRIPKPKPLSAGRIYPFDSNPKERLKDGFLEHDLLMEYIKQWSTAFEDLSKILYSKESKIMVSAVLLKAHVTTLHICLVGMLAADEMVYDGYTAEFEEVIELSEMVIKTETERQSTNFCFDVEVILSLQMVAMKCRISDIRRKAIALLLKSERREGVWDSRFFGRMMEWAADIEEEFMENGHVPGWARIRGVGKSPDLQRRTTLLKCQQRKSEFSDEFVTRTKVISW